MKEASCEEVSLLPDRPLTLEERAAHDEDPRPGVWAGEAGADLRRLTQEETDGLIRSELALEAAALNERSEVRRMIGGSGAWLVDPPATRQRGGIDSDPRVRLIAYRAWGDRDRQWFARHWFARGVRRDSTGLPALDRVLGGGLVDGSVALLAGRPGVGKTTLTLQALDGLGCRCLYVTSEETREHVAARARRVGATSGRIRVLSTGRLEEILEQAQATCAQSLAIDTIQMLSCGRMKGRPGSPAQIKECTARLVDHARTTGTTLWLVGHLTARGDIADHGTILHHVDVALSLGQEDDEWLLSCPDKNRFGLTPAAGRIRLTAEGFVEVDEEATNPNQVNIEREETP